MVNKYKWQSNVRCVECNQVYTKNEPSGAKFYNNFNKYSCNYCGGTYFYDSIEKWVNNFKWWNPKTWVYSGYWKRMENKFKQEDKRGNNDS